jgi:hypothetical protein
VIHAGAQRPVIFSSLRGRRPKQSSGGMGCRSARNQKGACSRYWRFQVDRHQNLERPWHSSLFHSPWHHRVVHDAGLHALKEKGIRSQAKFEAQKQKLLPKRQLSETEQLEKLHTLKEKGAITQEAFEEQKRLLLNGSRDSHDCLGVG